MTNKEALEVLEDLQRLLTHYRHISTELVEANGRAIDALEKQIPIKPIYTNKDTVTRCKCGAIHFQSTPSIKLDYCSRCGQAIDWNEVEE